MNSLPKTLTISKKIEAFQIGKHVHISNVLEAFVLQVKYVVYLGSGIVRLLIRLAHMLQIRLGQYRSLFFLIFQINDVLVNFLIKLLNCFQLRPVLCFDH